MNNIQKSWFCLTALPTFAPFCPFLGEKGIFLEKWQHHLKRLMVFYLHAKKYKKRLNGSKVRVIWKIERSDWSRGDLRRKFAKHNTLHFRQFLAKTNDSILRKSQKSLFLDHFCPFFRKWEFSRKIRLRHFSTFMVP